MVDTDCAPSGMLVPFSNAQLHSFLHHKQVQTTEICELFYEIRGTHHILAIQRWCWPRACCNQKLRRTVSTALLDKWVVIILCQCQTHRPGPVVAHPVGSTQGLHMRATVALHEGLN